MNLGNSPHRLCEGLNQLHSEGAKVTSFLLLRQAEPYKMAYPEETRRIQEIYCVERTAILSIKLYSHYTKLKVMQQHSHIGHLKGILQVFRNHMHSKNEASQKTKRSKNRNKTRNVKKNKLWSTGEFFFEQLLKSAFTNVSADWSPLMHFSALRMNQGLMFLQ